MVVLTTDVVLRHANNKGTKLRPEDNTEQFLRKLTHLNLPEKGIDLIGPDLSLCGNLCVIYLYDNNITHLGNSLQFAVNLTHLYLQNNCIERMEGLLNCTSIQKLYLSNNCIIVVEGLHTMQCLRELCVDSQRLPLGEKLIFDPRTVINISPTIEVLNVAGNNLDSTKELRCMTQMRQLNVSNNRLANMADLSDTISTMSYLNKLDAFGNPVMRKAKYRDRVITMNESIKVLDGKEVPESLKSFLRNWKSAKDRQRKLLIDQAMTDAIPDLPPLQKVPNAHPQQQPANARKTSSGKNARISENNNSRGDISSGNNNSKNVNNQNTSNKRVAPPIKRGMRSGQKELENILAKSKQQQQQQQQQIQNNNQQLHSDQQEYELLLPHHRVGDVSTRSGVVGTVVVAHTEDDYDVIGGVGKANENIIGDLGSAVVALEHHPASITSEGDQRRGSEGLSNANMAVAMGTGETNGIGRPASRGREAAGSAGGNVRGLTAETLSDEMPLLALTDPQSTSDTAFLSRQTTNVMDIQVRTPEYHGGPGKNRPGSVGGGGGGAGAGSRKQSGGQHVVPIKAQVMDFGVLSGHSGHRNSSGENPNLHQQHHLLSNSADVRHPFQHQLSASGGSAAGGGPVGGGGSRFNSGGTASSRATVLDVGFDKDEVKLNLE